jgi:hypothetical protein
VTWNRGRGRKREVPDSGLCLLNSDRSLSIPHPLSLTAKGEGKKNRVPKYSVWVCVLNTRTPARTAHTHTHTHISAITQY